MRLALVLLVACSSPQTPRSPEPTSHDVCPQAIDHAPWLHDLFPGCAPPPFWLEGVTCAGGCPMPCRRRFLDFTGARSASRFFYDKGRLASTKDGWDSRYEWNRVELAPKVRCDDEECKNKDDVIAKLHYSKGRIDAYNDVVLHYSSDRLDTEKQKRPAGQFTTYTYQYDERDRVSRITSSGWGTLHDKTYTYEGDRLIKTELTELGGGSTQTMTLDYDDHGRPVHVLLFDPERRMEQTYFYDCSHDVPFDGALVAFTALKQRACACADAGCSKPIADEIEKWRHGLADDTAYADPSPGQNAEFGKLIIAAETCLQAAQSGPH